MCEKKIIKESKERESVCVIERERERERERGYTGETNRKVKDGAAVGARAKEQCIHSKLATVSD